MVKLVPPLTLLGAAASTAAASSSSSASSLSTSSSATEGLHPRSSSSSLSSSSSCPISTTNFHELLHMYHGDHVCDRQAFNEFKDSFPVGDQFEFLQTTGQHVNVPTSHTVTCPTTTSTTTTTSLYSSANTAAIGFDTTWMVENTSRKPVVVAWVDPETQLEWSARHPDVSPLDDPETILQPGQWMAVQTFEGHAFHVREIEVDNGATKPGLGRLVLQHRVGLIPIRGKSGQQHCPSSSNLPLIADEDQLDDYVEDLDDIADDAYSYVRTPPQTQGRRCNRMEIGFRNLVGCPLHAYFVDPDTCQEEFKFHLGTQQTDVQDFMNDWESASKFESSFVGQTFVFRSADNDEVIVDEVTLLPTSIVDCPDSSSQAPIVTSRLDQAILLSSGDSIPNTNHNKSSDHNGTSWAAVLSSGQSVMSAFVIQAATF